MAEDDSLSTPEDVGLDTLPPGSLTSGEEGSRGSVMPKTARLIRALQHDSTEVESTYMFDIWVTQQKE